MKLMKKEKNKWLVGWKTSGTVCWDILDWVLITLRWSKEKGEGTMFHLKIDIFLLKSWLSLKIQVNLYNFDKTTNYIRIILRAIVSLVFYFCIWDGIFCMQEGIAFCWVSSWWNCSLWFLRWSDFRKRVLKKTFTYCSKQISRLWSHLD